MVLCCARSSATMGYFFSFCNGPSSRSQRLRSFWSAPSMTHFIRWRRDSDENGNLATRVLSGYEIARKVIIPLHVHHAFLFISLSSLPDYDVKLPIFTCPVMEDVDTRKRCCFSFSEVVYNSTPDTNVIKSPTRTFYNK